MSSSQAVQIVLTIQSAISVQLPATMVLNYPTLRKLALAVWQQQSQSTTIYVALPALMVTLQSHVLADGHAALPPLFLAAPGFGSSAAYFELSVQLGKSRMIYGLDFDETVSDPQQIAQHHTESIQRVNPTGIVHLGGF